MLSLAGHAMQVWLHLAEIVEVDLHESASIVQGGLSISVYVTSVDHGRSVGCIP